MKKDNIKKTGRPTLFKDEYIELAFNYCLLGATDEDLATFFDVQKSTINNWKKDFPSFLDSIKRGKELADSKVALSLYNRATGAIINTQQAFKVKTSTIIDGKKVESETIEIVDLKQEQPPDTTAAIFWLKNRKPDKWRDKAETVLSGEIAAKISINQMETSVQAFASNENEIEIK